MKAEGHRPTVFLCYHPADREWRDRLVAQLESREAEGELELWDESRIEPGEESERRIGQAIDEARIAVLLISSDFLASEDIRDKRRPRLLARRAAEGVHLVPVIVRHCMYEQEDWLAALRVWPEDGKPMPADDEHFAELARRVLELARGPRPVPRPQDVPPYRGLNSFGVGDAELFFGRQELVGKLLEGVRSASGDGLPHRCLAIVGSSGSGKSSLVRAGLVASLGAGAVEGSGSWPVIDLEPGEDPLRRLARKLLELEGRPFATPEVQERTRLLTENPRTLDDTAAFVLDEAPPERRLVVLVDQCEELFTRTYDPESRQAFFANLHHAATVPGGRALVVLSLRADFFGEFMNASTEAEKLLDRQVRVRPMTDAELREAIEEPMVRHGGEIEAGLVDLLLHDVEGQGEALPLLQYTLSELWRRDPRRLTVANYHEIGGLTRAVEASAERTFSRFDDAGKSACREMFLHLVQLTGTERYTRRRVDFQELVESAGGVERVEGVLRQFIEARLLTSTGTETERFVEVTHETLVNHWNRSRGWLEEEKEYLEARGRLEEAANDWTRNHQDPSFLYRGTQLARARKHTLRLPEKLREFLEASRRRQLRRRFLLGAAASASVFFVVVAWWVRPGGAVREAEVLAESADLLVELKPCTALLLALEAERLARAPGPARFSKAESILRRALARCGGEPLGAAGEHVLDIVFQDESVLVVARVGDHELRIRKVGLPLPAEKAKREGTLLCQRSWPDDQILYALLSPEGGQAAVKLTRTRELHRLDVTDAGCEENVAPEDDGDASAWQDHVPIPEILGEAPERVHGGPPQAVAGERWAVTWEGDEARLWDLDSPDPAAGPEPRTLQGFDGAEVLVGLSEDRLLDAGTDSPPRIRNLEGDTVGELRTCPGAAGLVALSPNRRWLVRAGSGGRICRWDLTAGQLVGEPLEAPSKLGPIVRIGVRHDGKLLGAVTHDGYPYLWSAANPEDTCVGIRSHEGKQFFLVLASDRWLATGSDQDEELRLWDLDQADAKPRVPLEKKTSLLAAGPGVPARWLVHAGGDATVHLVDLADDGPPVPLSGPKSALTAAAFSHDSLLLAAGETAGRVHLWDLGQRGMSVVLGEHGSAVRALTFLSGGARLASVDATGKLYLWTIGAELLEETACRVAGRDLTESEFREAVGESLPYHPICP